MPWVTSSTGQKVWQADNAKNPVQQSFSAMAPKTNLTNTGTTKPGQPSNTVMKIGDQNGKALRYSNVSFTPAPPVKSSWMDYQKSNPSKNYDDWKKEQKALTPVTDLGKKESITGYASEYGITPEAQLQEDTKMTLKAGEALGLKMPKLGLDETLQQWQANQKKKQDEKDLAAQEEANKQGNANDLEDIKIRRKQEEGATAAVLSQTSAGREGIQSTGNAMLGQQVTTEMNARMDRANEVLSNNKIARDKILENLQQAQEAGNLQLAESYQNQLAQAENNLANADAARQKTISEAQKVASDFVDKAVTFAQGPGGGALATMALPDIATLYHVDQTTAASLQNLAQQKVKLDQQSPEYQAKIAQINRDIEATKVSGLDAQTKALDLIGTYQSLSQFDLADKVARDAGLMDNPNYADQKGKINAALKNQTEAYKSSGAYIPAKGVYKVTPNGKGGIEIDVPVGQCPANGRGQCGEFSNDFYGLPPGGRIFGDSYASKADNINSKVPVVGGAFIMNTGDPVGHVGIITQTYPDGSFDYKDSNRHNNETVDTGHFQGTNYSSGGFSGFFDPKKPSPGWTPPQSMQPDLTADAETLMGHFPLLDSGKASEVDSMLIDDLASQYANGATLNDLKAQIDTTGVSKAKQAGYVANILHQAINNSGNSNSLSNTNYGSSNTLNNPTMEDLANQYANNPNETKLADLKAYADSQGRSSKNVLNQLLTRATEIKQKNINSTDYEDATSDQKTIIDDLLNYKTSLSVVTSKRGGAGDLQHIYALTRQEAEKRGIDWNESDNDSRQDFKKKWIAGKSDDKITAVNKVTNHIAALADSVDKLGGNLLQSHWGAAAGQAVKGVLGGNPNVTDYNVNAKGVADELENVFSGGTGSATSKEERLKDFAPTNTISEQKAAINKSVELMIGQIDPMVEDYKRNMGGYPKTSPLTKTTFDKLDNLYQRGYLDRETYLQAFDLYNKVREPLSQINNPSQSFDTNKLPKGFTSDSSAPVNNDNIMSQANQK